MARDMALLQNDSRAYLRLYRWDPPSLSFGRHEAAMRRYDRAEIERRGLAVVRRPTGGRAVWHEEEVTYAVAAPLATFGSLAATYREIHERIAAALRTLGVPAVLAERRHPFRPQRAGACFAATAGGEIVVAGRKIVGSAQLAHGRAVLQHGSILLGGSQALIGAVSREPAAEPGEASLAQVLGRPVAFHEVAQAVVAAWGERLHPAPFLPPLGPTPFADPAWTWRR